MSWRKLGGEFLREFAERIVDRRAAMRGRRGHVDRIERREPQNIFRVDRVGVAQPVLDRRHRELAAGPRAAVLAPAA